MLLKIKEFIVGYIETVETVTNIVDTVSLADLKAECSNPYKSQPDQSSSSKSGSMSISLFCSPWVCWIALLAALYWLYVATLLLTQLFQV